MYLWELLTPAAKGWHLVIDLSPIKLMALRRIIICAMQGR